MRIETHNFPFSKLERFNVFKETRDIVLDQFRCFGARDDFDECSVREEEEACEVLPFLVQLDIHALGNLVERTVAGREHLFKIFRVDVG